MSRKAPKNRFAIYATLLVVFAFAVAIAHDATVGWKYQKEARAAQLTGGSAARGADAIARYGCASCHIIPGIAHPSDSRVGPQLDDVGQRTYVGGVVLNKPENLVRWIMDPKAIDPHTAMPNMGVTEDDARDIATYLYSQR